MSHYDHERNICTYCAKMCHFSNPVAEEEKDETLTVWGKQQLSKLVLEKKIPFNPETAEVFFKHTDCRINETFCEHKIDVVASLQEMREEAVAKLVAPDAVYDFRKQFGKFCNPYGKDLQEKIRKLKKTLNYSGTSSTLFFASCHLTALIPEALKLYFDLFEKLGISDIQLFDGNLQCCGLPLWSTGFKEEFKDLAEVQYNSLRKAERIVAASPECVWTFRELYAKLGFKLKAKVLTLTEYLADYLKNMPFKSRAKTPVKYFYHDSSYQGRYLKQYEEARELLELVTGFPPHEFSWKRAESLCSGAEGTYALIEPEHALNIPKRHLQEMLDAGVKILVSSCPKSVAHFRKAMPGMIVKDLVSFLAENILHP